MLTALIGKEQVNVFDTKFDKHKLKQYSNKGIIKCPVCEGEYEYCHGEIVMPYFRHKGKECEEYYSEPETEEHMMGKKLLYEWIKKQDGVVNCKLEAWIPETKQRPDIYFEQNGNRYVIEYQCTPISSEYIKRRELYALAGITDIWILGTNKFNIRKDSKKLIESEVTSYPSNYASHFNGNKQIFYFNDTMYFEHEELTSFNKPNERYLDTIEVDKFEFIDGKFKFKEFPTHIVKQQREFEEKLRKKEERKLNRLKTEEVIENRVSVLLWQIRKYNEKKTNSRNEIQVVHIKENNRKVEFKIERYYDVIFEIELYKDYSRIDIFVPRNSKWFLNMKDKSSHDLSYYYQHIYYKRLKYFNTKTIIDVITNSKEWGGS